MKPTQVNILGTTYSIEYCDKPSDVDVHKREAMWGQIDPWTRTIRIYNWEQEIDIWKTVIHEVLHGIAEQYGLPFLNDDENHNELDALSGALADTFTRNGWLR